MIRIDDHRSPDGDADRHFEEILERLDFDETELAEAEELLRDVADQPVSAERLAATVARATAGERRPSRMWTVVGSAARRMKRVPLAAAVLGSMVLAAAVVVVALWPRQFSVENMTYPLAIHFLQDGSALESDRESAMGYAASRVGEAIQVLKQVHDDVRNTAVVRATAELGLRELHHWLESPITPAPGPVRGSTLPLIELLKDSTGTDQDRLLHLKDLVDLAVEGVLTLRTAEGLSAPNSARRDSYLRILGLAFR